MSTVAAAPMKSNAGASGNMTFKDKEKPTEVRMSNIISAKGNDKQPSINSISNQWMDAFYLLCAFHPL